MLPRLSACMAPFEPHKTSSSAGGSLTIVRRKSQAAATSCGDFASFAPAATNSSTREAVRFHTVREYPALIRFLPIGRPIKPSPINPIFFVPADDSKGGLLELAGPMQACAFLEKKRGHDCSRILIRKQSRESFESIRQTDQAVLWRWESGRIPGAPPAAAAAALRGLPSKLDVRGASGVAWGVAVTEAPFAEAPDSGFSWMRTRY